MMRARYDVPLTFEGFFHVAIRVQQLCRLGAVTPVPDDLDHLFVEYARVLLQHPLRPLNSDILNRILGFAAPSTSPILTFTRLTMAIACDEEKPATDYAHHIQQLTGHPAHEDTAAAVQALHDDTLDISSMTIDGTMGHVPPSAAASCSSRRLSHSTQPALSEQEAFPTDSAHDLHIGPEVPPHAEYQTSADSNLSKTVTMAPLSDASQDVKDGANGELKGSAKSTEQVDTNSGQPGARLPKAVIKRRQEGNEPPADICRHDLAFDLVRKTAADDATQEVEESTMQEHEEIVSASDVSQSYTGLAQLMETHQSRVYEMYIEQVRAFERLHRQNMELKKDLAMWKAHRGDV